MMRIIFACFVICCFLTTPGLPPAQADQDAAQEINKAAEKLKAGKPGTLEPEPTDDPSETRKKAALRLMAVYTGVVNAGVECGIKDQNAAKALESYKQRNGSTLAFAASTLQKEGGISVNLKPAMEAAIQKSKADMLRLGCLDYASALNAGQRDLYKAPGLADDYKILKAR